MPSMRQHDTVVNVYVYIQKGKLRAMLRCNLERENFGETQTFSVDDDSGRLMYMYPIRKQIAMSMMSKPKVFPPTYPV